ncbi:Disintegrin and metalloproteinase protein, partial [Daphnia magna]
TQHATRRRFQVSAICRVYRRRSQRYVEDAGSQHVPVGLVQLQPLFHHRVSRVSHIRTLFFFFNFFFLLLFCPLFSYR